MTRARWATANPCRGCSCRCGEARLRTRRSKRCSTSSTARTLRTTINGLPRSNSANRFGPAAADVQTVTDLAAVAQGVPSVARVSTGRTIIEFSGTAGQVRSAFHTEIHKYAVNGEQHFANNSDPQIPTALLPAVAGPVSLHNFPRRPASHILGTFRKTKESGAVAPLFSSANSCGTVTGAGSSCNALGPGDFAAIYNIAKLWSPGISSHAIDGTGQTIAIVGDSEICTAKSPGFNMPRVTATPSRS